MLSVRFKLNIIHRFEGKRVTLVKDRSWSKYFVIYILNWKFMSRFKDGGCFKFLQARSKLTKNTYFKCF